MSVPQLPLASTRGISPLHSEMDRPTGALEASLLQLLHEHQLTSFKLRDQSDRAKKEAMLAAMRVSELLMEGVNGGVQESFINEKRIELEIRALAATIMRYKKHTDQWLAASHTINTVIKEIGDFENWMKTMEYDCKSINAAILNIHQAKHDLSDDH
ncbi:hypothetical protein Nepgr_000010 [Nepenthes gracilis]|uniref:Biogenesis of lysosome-related organelles complex 1 subunit 1 n=1 Tax=Nepenthes gracilis TaxID=150966 RepID=A0AAD3P2N5_NEPGR|nr:hypothetical protein Nepgr_000010 [Nepenthes gracilis]